MRANLLALAAGLIPGPWLALAAPPPVIPQTVYISPGGDDQNPGTRLQPFRSLERARDWARSRNQNQSADLTIYLEGGTYRLAKPLVLTAQDSGNAGHNIIYAASPGQHPVVVGGIRITGWTLADKSLHLWSAPAPGGFTYTRQLYVNDVRADRTRGRLPVKLTQTQTGYLADSAVMAGWRNASDLEFVYTGGNALWSEPSAGLGAWTEPRCPVLSIVGVAITMAQPCWDNSTRRLMLPASSGFHRTANLVGPASVGRQPEYVENAFELLGTPGQWYFDRPARKFYYVPRPGEDLVAADVEAPLLEQLISAQGTPAAPVHNLVFKGIQFSYATWLLPCSNEGFSEIQANYLVTGPRGYATQGLCDLAPGGKCPFGAWTKTPGNVAFQFARQIQFLDDAFVHLGGAGLDLGDGSQNDTVEGCIFTDISANGIELGGVDLPQANPAQATSDNRILNNHIYNVATEYHGGVGILVGYAQNSLIAHNQLDHLPYTAISMGWGGWPDKIHRSGVVNISRNNIVANNLIFDHLQLLADGGAIYTQGMTGPSLAAGEKIIRNVIYNQLGSGHGIYTDNGCKNVTALSNVLFNVNFDDWGSRHRDYYNANDGRIFDAFDCEDNYWQQGGQDSSGESVTLKGNRLISTLEQAPQTLLRNAGLQPAFKDILSRQFGHPAAPEPPSRVAAAAGDGFALVSWNPPVAEGGAPVESYTVRSSARGQVSVSDADFRAKGYIEMRGLDNGREYAFTVEARNANGTSAPSLPSANVVPRPRTLQLPAAPDRAYAEPGDGMASVHFRGPSSAGGSPITHYVITIQPGGRPVVVTRRCGRTLGGRPSTVGGVDGLENGRRYTFEVAAANLAGLGPPAATRPVTPARN